EREGAHQGTARPAGVRWQAVALPPEHGSWGLVGEPVALGLLVAPAWAPFLVGLGAFAGFLAYRPAKLAWGDLRRGKRYPRTVLARRLATAFGLLAVLALGGALRLGWAAAGPGWLLPFALAAPFGIVFVAYDLRPGRSWQAEVTAPAAFAATAAAMAWAGGLPPAVALSLWAAMAARAVPSVLYVRERLGLERGESSRPASGVAAHLAGLAAVAAIAAAGWLPWLAASAVALHLVRAAWGLSRFRRPAAPRAIGFSEIGWGVVTVLLVAAGWWAGW
ncbi:MAG TPA: YwiC-like family protein, partial [Thermoanaerobaculia bacterium]|nr:YwiC-like family protein [Thermoanaerobaculia bacterium]